MPSRNIIRNTCNVNSFTLSDAIANPTKLMPVEVVKQTVRSSRTSKYLPSKIWRQIRQTRAYEYALMN